MEARDIIIRPVITEKVCASWERENILLLWIKGQIKFR